MNTNKNSNVLNGPKGNSNESKKDDVMMIDDSGLSYYTYDRGKNSNLISMAYLLSIIIIFLFIYLFALSANKFEISNVLLWNDMQRTMRNVKDNPMKPNSEASVLFTALMGAKQEQCENQETVVKLVEKRFNELANMCQANAQGCAIVNGKMNEIAYALNIPIAKLGDVVWSNGSINIIKGDDSAFRPVKNIAGKKQNNKDIINLIVNSNDNIGGRSDNADNNELPKAVNVTLGKAPIALNKTGFKLVKVNGIQSTYVRAGFRGVKATPDYFNDRGIVFYENAKVGALVAAFADERVPVKSVSFGNDDTAVNVNRFERMGVMREFKSSCQASILDGQTARVAIVNDLGCEDGWDKMRGKFDVPFTSGLLAVWPSQAKATYVLNQGRYNRNGQKVFLASNDLLREMNQHVVNLTPVLIAGMNTASIDFTIRFKNENYNIHIPVNCGVLVPAYVVINGFFSFAKVLGNADGDKGLVILGCAR